MREFTHNLLVHAPASTVLRAFFDPPALAAWWEVSRSMCIPKPLGSYAVEWEPTERHDAVLGRLGGTLHGTVVEFVEGREFFVGELYWLPPDGDPIGPMALAANCIPLAKDRTLLCVRQSGHDEQSERWSRYYDVVSDGWVQSLRMLKNYVERL
jgi:uncharacterized protein YndB with AHSA1/START domain